MNFKKLHQDAKEPTRGSEFAAGLDLCTIENADIASGKSAILKTGLAFAIESGYVGLVWPRSKLGAKKQIQVLAGCIDSDYRGEVMIALLNSGSDTLEVRKGDKIAQLLIQQVFVGSLTECENLDDTGRGNAGINSTEMRLR
jgi:dUTP pyrophosphatase